MFCWLACFIGSFEMQLSTLIKENCLALSVFQAEQKCILFII